jgi:catalase
MFAYPDAQRYRLGVNYAQLPPNRPTAAVYAPYERDGITNTKNYGGDPNYVRSTLSPGIVSRSATTQVRHLERVHADATLGLNELQVTEEDFEQPRVLWRRVFVDAERELWVSNVSETLASVPAPLREAVRAMFSRVDAQIGKMLSARHGESSHL